MAINGLGGIGGFLGGIGSGAYSRPRIERTYIPTGADFATARMGAGSSLGGLGTANALWMGGAMSPMMMMNPFILPFLGIGAGCGGGMPSGNTNMTSSMNNMGGLPMGQVF